MAMWFRDLGGFACTRAAPPRLRPGGSPGHGEGRRLPTDRLVGSAYAGVDPADYERIRPPCADLSAPAARSARSTWIFWASSRPSSPGAFRVSGERPADVCVVLTKPGAELGQVRAPEELLEPHACTRVAPSVPR